MNFGERLKQLRTAQGLTQPQFAQVAGIEQSYLSKLENDKSVPSADMFNTILGGLGIDEASFLAELDRGALAGLQHIPAVNRHTTQADAARADQSKRWIYGSALAWIVGFAMLLAANDGIFFSNWLYTFKSPGVILADEADNIFENHNNITALRLGAGLITVQQMSAELAEFQLNRVRPLTLERPTNPGPTYVEAVDGGRRQFVLEKTRHVQAPGNRVLQYLGAIVLASGFVGLFIEWRLRRLAIKRG